MACFQRVLKAIQNQSSLANKMFLKVIECFNFMGETLYDHIEFLIDVLNQIMTADVEEVIKTRSIFCFETLLSNSKTMKKKLL